MFLSTLHRETSTSVRLEDTGGDQLDYYSLNSPIYEKAAIEVDNKAYQSPQFGKPPPRSPRAQPTPRTASAKKD